ncbi:dickkopf-related protein 3 isoform X2 [Engystomops pustulosus]
MLLIVLAVTLGLVASSPVATPGTDDSAGAFEDNFLAFQNLDHDSLDEMFEEVEHLIEDTQTKLESAVKELEAQEAVEAVALKDLPPNYHNESVTETKVGNDTIVTKQEIVKETDNKTGSTFISRTIVSSLKDGDHAGHDCIVDEDCRPGNYCHISGSISRCLPCKEEETCTRDGECCQGRLCVWGQCRTSTKGENGTICESQQDCGPGLCCAVHTGLLFPVCTPLPGKGEQCQTRNPLLEIFTWDLESEVPVSLCPCPSGLVCRTQSLVSVCEDPSLLDDTEEDLQFFPIAPEDEVESDKNLDAPLELGLGNRSSEESELVPQPEFIGFI